MRFVTSLCMWEQKNKNIADRFNAQVDCRRSLQMNGKRSGIREATLTEERKKKQQYGPHAPQIFSIIVFFCFFFFCFCFVGASGNLYATWFIAFIISIRGWRIASKRIKVKLKSYAHTLTHAHKHLLSHRFGQLSMGEKNVYAHHRTWAWKMCVYNWYNTQEMMAHRKCIESLSFRIQKNTSTMWDFLFFACITNSNESKRILIKSCLLLSWIKWNVDLSSRSECIYKKKKGSSTQRRFYRTLSAAYRTIDIYLACLFILWLEVLDLERGEWECQTIFTTNFHLNFWISISLIIEFTECFSHLRKII